MIRWFQSKKFAVQLIILAVVFDPLGFASGYLLAPSFDIAPIYGGIAGLQIRRFVVANRSVGVTPGHPNAESTRHAPTRRLTCDFEHGYDILRVGRYMSGVYRPI